LEIIREFQTDQSLAKLHNPRMKYAGSSELCHCDAGNQIRYRYWAPHETMPRKSSRTPSLHFH
jgi:hypothetical protein